MYLQIDARLCLYSFRLKDYEYEQLADETLDSLTEVFEDLPDRLGSCGTEYDVTFGVSSVNRIALRKAKILWSFSLYRTMPAACATTTDKTGFWQKR